MYQDTVIQGYSLAIEYIDKSTFNKKAAQVCIYNCFNNDKEIICYLATILNLKNSKRQSKYFDDLDDAQRWAFSESKKITSNQTPLYSKGK